MDQETIAKNEGSLDKLKNEGDLPWIVGGFPLGGVDAADPGHYHAGSGGYDCLVHP